MKSTAVSELKASLSHLKKDDLQMPPHLKELERAGLIRSGSGAINKEFWKLPRPSDSKGLALKALLEERQEWR